MSSVVYFLKYIPISNWIILPIQIVIGGVVFILLCKIMKIEEYDDVLNSIKPLINKAKK